MTAKDFLNERGAKAAIAEKMKVSRQTVSLWTTGQVIPSGKNLIALTKALNELGILISSVEVLELLKNLNVRDGASSESID